MTQENKKLLLKDLSARLPYGVRIKIGRYSGYKIIGVDMSDDKSLKITDTENEKTPKTKVPTYIIKPYLRPMSSMTEEEKEEFHKLKQFSVTVVMPNGVSLLKPTYMVDLEEDGEGLNHLYDWLNANHFDYRGLIEKGLALEALDGMYNIKKK